MRRTGALTLSPRWTPKMGEGVYTQFTLNYEKGKQDANQPTLTPPLDFMSNWYERMGKYVRPDTYNGAPAALNIGPYYIGSNGGAIGWFDTYAVVFARSEFVEGWWHGYRGCDPSTRRQPVRQLRRYRQLCR